jgi:cell division protein FtsB
MATIDEINLLDYQAPTPEQILKAGRKPVAEPIPYEERDPFYYKILNPSGRKLVDMVRAEINNPLNYLAGAGGISKAKGIASVISDDVAKRIFSFDQEMDALKTLNKRQDRIKDKLFDFDDELTAKQTKMLEAEQNALESQINKLENNIQDKVKKRFDFSLQKRTISGLDPAKVDRLSTQDILKATSGQKNKTIIEQLGKHLDSPGINYFGTRYGTKKFGERLARSGIASLKPARQTKYDLMRRYPDSTPEEIRNIMFNTRDYNRIMDSMSRTKVDPSGEIQYLNPLEAFEKGSFTSQTFQIGDTATPLFVDPKKLANKLDKSASGDDFFKLRTEEEGYLSMLEESIKKKGYKPSPIDIVVQPSGNTVISEGNHRLYRALSRGDAEVPINIKYEAGAERLDVPFGINDIDTLLADGQKGFKSPQEFAKYIKDVEKTYKPASTKIADDIDKIAQGISNRQQQIAKLKRELELEGGDMLPKTVKSTERKIVKLMKEIDEMSK